MRIILLIAAGFLLQACSGDKSVKLPILGERSAMEKQVNGTTVTDTVYHTIAPFRYLNQDSMIISDRDFDGKIYVADFFFTSCNTICPTMHRNMLEVYKKYRDHPRVKILSHSIDVKYDLPSRLKSYAGKLGAEGNQWEFVHGSRDSIFNVAVHSYLSYAKEDSSDPQGLVHQGWFVLVDTQKRIRGAYDGTDEGAVKKLLQDMDILLAEESPDEK